jgi:hypothetical protein
LADRGFFEMSASDRTQPTTATEVLQAPRLLALEAREASLKEEIEGLRQWQRASLEIRDLDRDEIATLKARIQELDGLLAKAADELNITPLIRAMDLGAKITAYRLAQQKAAQPKDTAK